MGLLSPFGAGHCQCLSDQMGVLVSWGNENQAKQRLYQCYQYHSCCSLLAAMRKPVMLQHPRDCSSSLPAAKHGCSSLLQETLMRRKSTILMVQWWFNISLILLGEKLFFSLSLFFFFSYFLFLLPEGHAQGMGNSLKVGIISNCLLS